MLRIFTFVLCLAGIITCQGCALWGQDEPSKAEVVFMPVSQQVDPNSPTQTELKSPRTVYVRMRIRSEPDGATIKIKDTVIGKTPLIVSIPFAEGTYGKPTGSTEITLQKPGYLPRVVELFANADRTVSLEAGGKPLDKYIFHLKRP